MCLHLESPQMWIRPQLPFRRSPPIGRQNFYTTAKNCQCLHSRARRGSGPGGGPTALWKVPPPMHLEDPSLKHSPSLPALSLCLLGVFPSHPLVLFAMLRKGAQARKRHIDINFFVRLVLGRPRVCSGDFTAFVPGTNETADVLKGPKPRNN